MNKPSLSDYGTYDESTVPQLWDGVVGAWCPSLGPTGSRLHDFSRFNNWGTLTNMDPATDWVVDGGQYALDFDGTDATEAGPGTQNRIQIDKNLILSSFGVSMWIYPQSANKRGLIANGPYNTNPTFAITILANYTLETYRGANTTSTVAMNANAWNHFLVFNDTATTTYYINGKLSNTAAQTLTATASQTQTYIGYNYWGATNSLIDDVVFWSRLPTSPEVAALYQLGRGGMFQRRRRRRAYVSEAVSRRRRLICGAEC